MGKPLSFSLRSLWLRVEIPLLLCFVALHHSIPVSAWKKEEFRSCNQTPFCKRARSLPTNSSAYHVLDLALQDGDLTGQLLFGDDSGSSKPLSLRISVYHDGILRLKIDESPSDSRKRFEVPDVLVETLDQEKKLWLQKVNEEGDFSIVFIASGYEAVVRHSPFEVFIRRSGDKQRVLSFNSIGLFDFEQLLSEKPEGENWEENFRSHTDSRPHGPQSISLDVSFHGAKFVYGIPEHATSLALKPTRGPGVESEPYRLFNLDVFEYHHDSPFGLYGSIPFMISHGVCHSGKSNSAGFFWLNAAEMQIDVLSSDSSVAETVNTHWMSEAGIVDAFFFVGPGPKDVVKQYMAITGTPAMPQLFATAYHQCRWNYRDEEDVAQVDSKFDEFDIPYDVLWLDIEHTEGKKYFTWDKVLFPDPEGMQKKLAAKGRKMVTIVDPHIKRDDSYKIHKEASEKGYYVKDSSGSDFDGWCWPGSSSYLDMLSPEIREWWAEKFSLSNYRGSTDTLYIWNDMNEPSVFNGPEVTMPRDAIHYGGAEHREVHNAYGFYFHMASADGLRRRGGGNDRPFVLSRAFFAGSQRIGAVWSGDNTADWDHLRISVPMLLTLGLTGMTFSGADIGGFFGNPDPELLLRWYQIGAYYPFFRAHAHHDTQRREPWLFGDRKTELIREAIHVRYGLLPYYYTLFREANLSGIPVMRPLWMEFPSDDKTFSNDEAFMIGSGLLVQGIYTEGVKSASVYLPGRELWYDLRNGVAYSGGQVYQLQVSEESIPTFQRGGTIIPRKDRFRRSTTQMAVDPYTLVIALNSSSEAEGELYIDDGKSYEFQQGAYIHRRFIFSGGKLTSINIAGAKSGKKDFTTECVIERIILLGHPSQPKSALIKPANDRVDVESGPLLLRRGAKPFAAVIRNPKVQVGKDWTIEVL
ncbi:unnamed protein product [Victoria cruziana]